jgi:hypothetical protein
VSGQSRITCSQRVLELSPWTRGGCWRGRRFSIASTVSSRIGSWGRAGRGRSCRGWRSRTHPWCRLTRAACGFGTTSSSPTVLRLELEQSEPEAIPELHHAAADWFGAQGQVVEAIRHSLAAGEWESAARQLAEHSVSLALDDRGETLDAVIGEFPVTTVAADADLALISARGEVVGGSLGEAESYIALAERGATEVADDRRRHFEFSLALTRLLLARRRGDFASALAEAQPLLAVEGASVPGNGTSGDVQKKRDPGSLCGSRPFAHAWGQWVRPGSPGARRRVRSATIHASNTIRCWMPERGLYGWRGRDRCFLCRGRLGV